MSFATKIQDHLNHGAQIAANKLGSRWDIYRNGAKLRTNLKAYITPKHLSYEVEFAPGSFVYEAIVSRKLKLDTGAFDFLHPGDQFQGKDIASRDEELMTGERYTIVGLRLLHSNIAVRTDEKCQIYRPTTQVGLGVQAPTYNYEFFKTATQLAFDPVAGVWAFEAQPINVAHIGDIYCGITRIGAGSYDPGNSLPLATPSTGWLASCQLFYDGAGAVVELTEEDVIVDPSLSIYRVDRNYWQSEAAFLNQAYCTRLIR